MAREREHLKAQVGYDEGWAQKTTPSKCSSVVLIGRKGDRYCCIVLDYDMGIYRLSVLTIMEMGEQVPSHKLV